MGLSRRRSGARAVASAEYTRPWLYEKQASAIFTPRRYAIIEASTKSGKTWGCIVWLFEQAALTGAPGRHYWWVAPLYAQTRIAFRRFLEAMVAEPPADPRALIELCAVNESRLSIILPNGATIWFKSADNPDGLYGEDVYAAVLDEATRMKEDAYIAVRTTLTATRGPIRIIGNVKGKRNWAYRLARRAEAGDADMHHAKLTAFDAARARKPDGAFVLSEAEIEDARRNLPAAVFAELYLAEATDDGQNPFGLADIRACIAPRSERPVAVWGVDLAKSVDWTVLIGLDEDGHTVDVHRWQRPWRDTIRWIRSIVGATPTLVDSTGVGDPVLEELQGDDHRGSIEGFKFTSQSKQRIMEGLALDIQQRGVTFPAGPVVLELESFEFVYTRTGVKYSAPEGMHDDCVCALALARTHLHSPAAAPVRLW